MTKASHHTGSGSAQADQLLEMDRRMRRIRRFEERASDLYKATEIPGFLHLSIGQEASAVGACWPLGARDGITSTHRGHGSDQRDEDGIVVLLDENPPAELADDVRNAAAVCPALAIRIEE